MRAFEVRRNGELLCTAGVEGKGVLSAMINNVAGRGRSDLWLDIGGLDSATDEHLLWRRTRLKTGDEISMKIVESGSVDRPRRRYRPDSAQAERNAKAYVRAVAKKYGWKLLTR